MRFNLYKPCDSCPFLKSDKGCRLTVDRVKEIAGMMLQSQGSTFACHKTTFEVEDDEGESDMAAGAKSKHCAGALIFAEKNGNATQTMRIMERIGEYKRHKFMEDLDVVNSVFDSLDDMVEVNRKAFGGGAKKKRKRHKVK